MKIVVLEDMVERVDWLMGAVAGTGVEVVWCPTVREFREAMADPDDVALIVLDHDLGPHSNTSEDAGGETGLDAARWLPSELAPKIPVLVWSVNQSGAESMRLALASRGFTVHKCAFLSDNKWALRRLVTKWPHVIVFSR